MIILNLPPYPRAIYLPTYLGIPTHLIPASPTYLSLITYLPKNVMHQHISY
jgi:hypothetical protein